MVVLTDLSNREMSIIYTLLQDKINDLIIKDTNNKSIEKIQELTDLRDKFI